MIRHLQAAIVFCAMASHAAAESPFADRMEPFSTQARCMAKLSETLADMQNAEATASLYQGQFAKTAVAAVEAPLADLAAIYAEIARLAEAAAQAHMNICQSYPSPEQ